MDAAQRRYRRPAEVLVIPGVHGGLIARLPRQVRDPGQRLLRGKVTFPAQVRRIEERDIDVPDPAGSKPSCSWPQTTSGSRPRQSRRQAGRWPLPRQARASARVQRRPRRPGPPQRPGRGRHSTALPCPSSVLPRNRGEASAARELASGYADNGGGRCRQTLGRGFRRPGPGPGAPARARRGRAHVGPDLDPAHRALPRDPVRRSWLRPVPGRDRRVLAAARLLAVLDHFRSSARTSRAAAAAAVRSSTSRWTTRAAARHGPAGARHQRVRLAGGTRARRGMGRADRGRR